MDGPAENSLIIGVKGNWNQQDATNPIMWEQEHWNTLQILPSAIPALLIKPCHLMGLFFYFTIFYCRIV